MPRAYKGPVLHFRKREGRWYIRDRKVERSTECREHEVERARQLLAAFNPRTGRITKRRFLTGDLYVISHATDPTYPVKIGYSGASLYFRLKNLQVGNPHPLAIIASCKAGFQAEKALHARLAAHKLIGEWFARTPEVEAIIEDIRNGRLG